MSKPSVSELNEKLEQLLKIQRETGDSGDGTFLGLKKWQWALIVGSTIGVGIYCYRRNVKKNGVEVIKGPQTITSKILDLKKRGNEYFSSNNFKKAIDCYSEAVKLCIDNNEKDNLSILYQNRAAGHDMLKDYEKVIEDCTSSIKLDKRYVRALRRRSKAYESIDNIELALYDISVVNFLDQFKNQSDILIFERLITRMARDELKKIREYRNNEDLSMPSNPQIISYYRMFSRDPIFRDVDAVDANLIELKLNELKNSEPTEEINAKIDLLEATIDLLRMDYEKASKRLSVILTKNVSSDIKVNALIKMASIKINELPDTSDIDKVLQMFQKAVDIDPNNPDIYAHRAQFYMTSEAFSQAEEEFVKSCQLNPSFAWVLAQKLYVDFRSAFASNNHQALQKSLNDFEEALKKLPKVSELYILYGQAMAELGRKNETQKMLLEALKVDPKDPNIYVHLGIFYLEEDLSKAISYFNQAIEIDSQCQFAYEMLGNVAMNSGQLQKALDTFDQAIKSCKSDQSLLQLIRTKTTALAQKYVLDFLGT